MRQRHDAIIPFAICEVLRQEVTTGGDIIDAVIHAVVDTNVLFAGLTNGDVASDLVIQAWRAELFRACVSTALVTEYQSALSNKLSAQGWKQTRPALRTLLDVATPVQIHFTWRPSSPDFGDDMVIDCALNANALIVTHNKRDFRQAQRALGLQVLTAKELVDLLAELD
jgi:predicted nucleic acid-binding protein